MGSIVPKGMKFFSVIPPSISTELGSPSTLSAKSVHTVLNPILSYFISQGLSNYITKGYSL